MQITLSSDARNRLEQIVDYLYTRFEVEDIKPDELVDAIIHHTADLIASEDRGLNECRDKLVQSCSLKVGIHTGTGAKQDENEEYRG